jgi:hypothetical protein
LDRKKEKKNKVLRGGNFEERERERERERENYLKSIRSLTPLLIFTLKFSLEISLVSSA